MSLFTRNAKNTGSADPARAFGSEEQLMAEFSRQEFVRPQQRNRVISGIRERLSSLTARPHETDAPVYSAETYADENAPDLGWEAAFDPESAQPSSPAGPEGPSPEERFERFRSTVYSSPARTGSGYSFGSYTRPAPVYEELTFSGPARPASVPERPVYEEINLRGPERREAPSAAAAPVYEDLTPGPRRVSEPAPSPDPAPAGSPSGETLPGPVRPSASVGRAPHASDLQYMFWSGTIIAGVALTVFSFIYACVM